MAPRSLSPEQKHSLESTYTFLKGATRVRPSGCAPRAREARLNATWREFVEKHRAVARTKGGNK